MTAGTVTTAGPSPMPRVPRVLSIAGTDPTGGAGIQADLKSIAAHDGYGMAVVTALVAQNTRGVRSVHVPDSAFLGEQLDAVWDDVTVDAVKTGMLGTAEVVRVVVDGLRRHRPRWLVVDPVMVATSGDRLLDRDAEAAMVDLFALADLVTPNRDELRVLADLAGSDATDPLDAALAVARHFDVRVLAKGGHDGGPTSDDALVTPDGSVRVFTGPRVATENTHGTGCSLSSAIATTVARHGDWELAVGTAKTWLTAALLGADALAVGQGHGPVDHNAVVRAALPTPRVTDVWWTDATAVLDDTLACTFLRGLADGTLDAEVFAGYLAQDVHYLRAYEQHLRAVAAGSTGDAAAFWTSASEGCADEARDLHHRRLAGSHADDPVHPVCAGYLAHLSSAADEAARTGDVSVLAAAVLPCFRVYAWVGERLGTAPVGHPFADWITAYGDPAFATSSARATDLVEELAARADPELRGRMARAFRESVAQELAFFRMPEQFTGPLPDGGGAGLPAGAPLPGPTAGAGSGRV
ncbi:bifunctional hydroxymethylpyrimidine kinase/phosphomethylpyrimidine kinase [Curtobacterium sp. MCSS17_015]|uniref:bifunctional hydroxymethylpyrimidine kinase/phosphomethylpyrimidine kinase n=1 Tax=Curtobacterium sp. MCSS17_015 TaxID=2175666 RepID=UPI0021AC4408|nr:bifunctional hydroxymethylpyrimidine kinase/phosphomethylpyrimidine kinase [Curtobacterium sp. MCSS17_015]WIB27594.1 bifunctional hydroxymethylpyrimidine kinase/phosphomethylpyrimidine kinase [Curtobacterium sp. MCSS17_015]